MRKRYEVDEQFDHKLHIVLPYNLDNMLSLVCHILNKFVFVIVFFEMILSVQLIQNCMEENDFHNVRIESNSDKEDMSTDFDLLFE